MKQQARVLAVTQLFTAVVSVDDQSGGIPYCALLHSFSGCNACRQSQQMATATVRRRAIPEKSRLGTQFVFRQGSPLNIMDLRDIAVAQAAAVIVLGDNSRPVDLPSRDVAVTHV